MQLKAELVLASCKAWLRSWFAELESLLLGSILLSTLLGMVLPSAGPARDVFWVLTVPLMLRCLFKNQGYKALLQCKELRWVALIFLLYVASVFWSEVATDYDKRKVASHAVQSCLFVIALFFALRAESTQVVRFAKGLIVVCALGAVVVLLQYYSEHALAVRLYSDASALLGYPTYSGPVLLGCWIAAGLILEKERAAKRREWLFGGFLFIGTFVFLSQTRTAVLSGLFLFMLWGGFYWGVKRSLGVVFLLSVLVVLAVISTHALDHAWSKHIDVGMGGRLYIWEQDIRAFLQTPIYGQGAATVYENTIYGKAVTLELRSVLRHPHGLFFSMLFYFGLTGVLLWFVHIFSIAKKLFSCRGDLRWFALFALLFLLLVTATDVHKLIDNVGVNWWIWWLPVMTLLYFAQPRTRVCC